MIELEIQVLSDRREGLVMEIGQVISAHNYASLRQRLTQDGRGALLSMLVRGPSEQRLALEEMLGTHHRVLSFEAALSKEAMAISVAAPKVASPGLVAEPRLAFEAPAAMPDIEQVEQILPRLVQDFPHIYSGLAALKSKVTGAAQDPSMFLAGRRVGLWVYKRDYAGGVSLGLGDAIKRIAVPALRQIAQIEPRGVHVHVLDCPMCDSAGGSGCRFYGGYLEGLLGAALADRKVRARQLSCRGAGAAHCSLEISH
ncbi:hypothetical protein [Dyella choica]|nr:hypothetical protein [Dyella choica]